MERVLARAGGVVILALGLSAAAASAQDRPGGAPVTSTPRFSIEGAAGFQIYYRGHMQSVAFGFAPTRNLTLLVNAERSYVADEFERYPDGYALERGGTEQSVSAELRFAFFPTRRLYPYVLGGTGRGISRPNVNELFPHQKRRGIQVLYYGGGVRIPVQPRLDVFVDARLIMAVEATSDYFGVHLPVRAGIAWRF